MKLRRAGFIGVLLSSLGCGPQVEPPAEWPDWNDGRVVYWGNVLDSPSPIRELRFVDIATGEEAVPELGESHAYSWSLASGGDIIVLDRRGSWYVAFDASTGERIGIVEANDCNPVTALSTEPSGDRITLATVTSSRCSQSGMELHLIRIDREPSEYSAAMTDAHVIAESDGVIQDAGWAPGGDVLAFTSRLPDESWELVRVDLATGVASKLLSLPAEGHRSVSAPVLAADGVAFAVSRDRTIHTHAGTFVLDERVRAMHWSPDGATLLASTSAGSVWSVEVASGDVQPLVFGDPRAVLIGWSASGAGPTFLEGCGADGVQLWGTGEDGCLEGVNSGVWSPEQDLLLLQSDRPHVVDLGARVVRALRPGIEARWVAE